jgi:hypothetical protein
MTKKTYTNPDRFDHVYSFARCIEEANQICITANSAGVTGPRDKFLAGGFYVVATVHSDLGNSAPAVCGKLTR